MLRARTTQRLENKAGARFSGVKNLPLKSKVSMVVLGLVVLAAIFAPLIAPHDPLATGTPIQPPSGEHWFVAVNWLAGYRLGVGSRGSSWIDRCDIQQSGL